MARRGRLRFRRVRTRPPDLPWWLSAPVVLVHAAGIAALYAAYLRHPRRGLLYFACWLAASLLLAVAAAWLSRRSDSLLGYDLDGDGLTERRPRRRRRWRWDQLRAVDIHADHARVTTDEGELVLDAEVSGWRELAERLRAGLGTADARETLPRARLATWLGIAARGSVRAAPDRPAGLRWDARAASVVTLGLLATMVGWLATEGRAAAGGALGLVGLGWLAGWRRRRRQPAALEADVRGLTMHRANGERVFCPWDELQWACREGEWCLFGTGAEAWRIPAAWRGAEGIVRAAEQIVGARRAGLVPPRMDALPEAGLSRAAQDVTVDRGLSREP